VSAREGGRKPDQLRRISFEPDYLENPHGSVVITQGRTKVLCTAMVEEEVPRWLRKQGRGWITAEYSLLPASTGERVQREAARGKQQGRTVEIQRLIGRAVRAVADFEALGERTLWLDCDVLQADGGTRCAAICGAYVAAMRALDRFGLSRTFRDSVAAVSVGVVEGTPLLDLDYGEDSSADTDMNVVMTGDGRLVEVQATAERDPFARETLDELLALTGLVRVTRAENRPHYSIHRTSSTPSISATPATTAGAEPPLVSSTSTATERRSPSCATSSDTTRPLCRSIASMIGAGLPPAGISTSSRWSAGRNLTRPR